MNILDNGLDTYKNMTEVGEELVWLPIDEIKEKRESKLNGSEELKKLEKFNLFFELLHIKRKELKFFYKI